MIHVLSLSTKAGENGRQRHIDLQIMAVIFRTECGTAFNIANKKCAPSLLASARMHGGEPTFPANSALPLVLAMDDLGRGNTHTHTGDGSNDHTSQRLPWQSCKRATLG